MLFVRPIFFYFLGDFVTTCTKTQTSQILCQTAQSFFDSTPDAPKAFCLTNVIKSFPPLWVFCAKKLKNLKYQPAQLNHFESVVQCPVHTPNEWNLMISYFLPRTKKKVKNFRTTESKAAVFVLKHKTFSYTKSDSVVHIVPRAR